MSIGLNIVSRNKKLWVEGKVKKFNLKGYKTCEIEQFNDYLLTSLLLKVRVRNIDIRIPGSLNLW